MSTHIDKPVSWLKRGERILLEFDPMKFHATARRLEKRLDEQVTIALGTNPNASDVADWYKDRIINATALLSAFHPDQYDVLIPQDFKDVLWLLGVDSEPLVKPL